VVLAAQPVSEVMLRVKMSDGSREEERENCKGLEQKVDWQEGWKTGETFMKMPHI
jgi:hypothetical protein